MNTGELIDDIVDERSDNKLVSELTPEQANLVKDNVGLAYYVANKSIKKHPDAQAVAKLALAKAAKRWDQKSGIQFNHYATATIKKAIIDLANQDNEYRLSTDVNLDDTDRSYKEYPQDEDERLEPAKHSVSDEETPKPSHNISKKEAKNLLNKAMSVLTNTENVIVKRIMSGESYRDMAPDLNMSFVNVGNIARKAYTKMKTKLAELGVSNAQDIIPESFSNKLVKEKAAKLVEALISI